MAIQGPDLERLVDEHYRHYAKLSELVEPNMSRPPVENLVFEGGGAKGVVYLGVMQALEENDLMKDVKRVMGSSAGSIISMILSLGYNYEECKEILANDLSLKNLMDQRCEWDPKPINLIGIPFGISTICNLYKHKGAFKGEAIKSVLESLVEKKLKSKIESYLKKKYEQLFIEELARCEKQHFSKEITKERMDMLLEHLLSQYLDEKMIHDLGKATFSQVHEINQELSEYPELKGLDLFVTGTRLTDGSLKVFSHINDPNMSIALAVRISSSFPGGFEPVYYQGHYYADGGIADNFPITYFDREPNDQTSFLSHGLDEAGGNPCTLGFLVDSEQEIKQRFRIAGDDEPKDLSFKNFLKHLGSAYQSRLETIKEKHGARAIQIHDVGIETMDLNVSDEKISEAIRTGRRMTQDYINHFMRKDVFFKMFYPQDVYQHYFTFTKVQLEERFDDLGENLAQITGLIDVLKGRDLDEEYNSVEKQLEMFDDELVQQQEALYVSIKHKQQSLASVVDRIVDTHESLKKMGIQKNNLIRARDDILIMLDDNHLSLEEREEAIGREKELQRLIRENLSQQQISNKRLEQYYEDEQALEKVLIAAELEEHHEIYDLIYKREVLDTIEAMNLNITLETICEQYHEHIDVLLDVMEAKGLTPRDPRVEFMTTPGEVKEAVDESAVDDGLGDLDDYMHAMSLSELTQRLATGNWSDYISFTTKSDIVHNEQYMQTIEDGQTIGKWTSAFQVQHVKVTPTENIEYKAFKKIIPAPPIEAHVLSPESISISSKEKPIKEIVMVFHDSLREEGEARKKRGNYSLMSKCHSMREQHIQSNKDVFLQQIKWQLRKIRQADLQPNHARIHLTLSGEGLGAMDAQLMMAELVHVMQDPVTANEYEGLDQVELVVQDLPRVSAEKAKQFARDVQSLNKRDGAPLLKMYQINHKSTDRRFQPESYLGQVAMTTDVKPQHMEILFEERRHGKLKQALTNQLAASKQSLYETLNHFHWLYDTPWYRGYRSVIHGAGQFFKWLAFKFVPTLAKVLFNVAKFITFTVPKFIFSIPFRSASALVKRFRKIFKRKKTGAIKNWQASIELAKEKGRQVMIDAQPVESLEQQRKHFMRETSPDKRVEREKRPPVQNVVFGGGGINNLAMVGALKSLDEHGKLDALQRVAGTSYGGVIAALVAIGYSPDDIEKVLYEELSLEQIADAPCNWDPTLFKFRGHNIGLSSLISLFKNKGIYKGEAFVEIMGNLMADKLSESLKEMILLRIGPANLARLAAGFNGSDVQMHNLDVDSLLERELNVLLKQFHIDDLKNITFAQLQMLKNEFPSLNVKELYLTGTKLSDTTLAVFSHKTKPDMSIVEALAIGMVYPGSFYPREYNGEYYVSGEIADSYPVSIFDSGEFLEYGLNDANVNPCTLGLLVENQDDINARWGLLPEQHKDINLLKFIDRVIAGVHNRSERIHDVYQINTIQILNPRHEQNQFKVTPEHRTKLIESGKQTMDDYMNLYWGDDVIYSTHGNYSNVYHRYYGKPEAELIRIHTEEMTPLLLQGNALIEAFRPEYENLTQEYQSLVEMVNFDHQHALDYAVDLKQRRNQNAQQAKLLISAIESSKAEKAKVEEDIAVLSAPYLDVADDEMPPDILERLEIAQNQWFLIDARITQYQTHLQDIDEKQQRIDEDLSTLEDALPENLIQIYNRYLVVRERLGLMDQVQERIKALQDEEQVIRKALKLKNSHYCNIIPVREPEVPRKPGLFIIRKPKQAKETNVVQEEKLSKPKNKPKRR